MGTAHHFGTAHLNGGFAHGGGQQQQQQHSKFSEDLPPLWPARQAHHRKRWRAATRSSRSGDCHPTPNTRREEKEKKGNEVAKKEVNKANTPLAPKGKEDWVWVQPTPGALKVPKSAHQRSWRTQQQHQQRSGGRAAPSSAAAAPVAGAATAACNALRRGPKLPAGVSSVGGDPGHAGEVQTGRKEVTRLPLLRIRLPLSFCYGVPHNLLAVFFWMHSLILHNSGSPIPSLPSK